MKSFQFLVVFTFLFSTYICFSQETPERKKVKITGKIMDKATKKPLEYATISIINAKNTKIIFGGITDDKGDFSFDAIAGMYTVKIEFISFKSQSVANKLLKEDTNLGIFFLDEDSNQLQEVVVKSDKKNVEIKLDKKVYNVGQDITAKGGTASDVLDNVPSVTVDGDGNVSLRGNDNVKIFIDGRPSTSINIADALKTISADALDKIEVISNPSARYDAEGGAGIINLVLKKGRNQGLNGTFSATIGNPKNYNTIGNLNFKTEKFNIYSTLGYINSNALGNAINNSDFLNFDGSIKKTINERINRQNGRKGFNYSFGLDWYLDNSITWTNGFSYRKADGSSPINDDLFNYEFGNTFIQNRFNDQFTSTTDIEYTSNFAKKFKKDGHIITFNFTTSKNFDNDIATITNSYQGSISTTQIEKTGNFQRQNKNLIQLDYVLPIGKNSQYEVGYKGDFNKLLIDYNVGGLDNLGNYIPNPTYTNIFDYKEKFNALYTQFGSKIGNLSYLAGLRYENSNIDINLLSTNDLKNKKYDNFFPSAFLNYEITDGTNVTLNYSKRITRPRNRFLSPFSNYTSNINLFIGNSDLNPSITDALELGFLKKIGKSTFSTTLYYNKTKAPFQFIRRPNGETVSAIVNGLSVITPVYISTGVNLDTDDRYGIEFNVNYSPVKWWKLNGNFNLFESKLVGLYTYSLNNSTQIITQSGAVNAGSWFVKLNSKITLPYKIDWQTNATYNAPQNNAQGKSLGIYGVNMGFSKDVLKDKATISLNVSDLFNSRKMINEFNLPTLNSYSERQMRQRQINLTFVYRFNKQKTEKEKLKKPQQENGGDDF